MRDEISVSTNEPLLTIAIPTFNRKGFLEECLRHVIPQVEKDVEVVVCDNASLDGTRELMERYCREYPCIRYLRSEVNKGGDANVLRCLREGRGTFVHVLADDDILLPGSVAEIKKVIKEDGKFPFIHLNFRNFKGSFDLEGCSAPHYCIARNVFFDDKDELLRYFNIYTTLLPATVLRRAFLDRIEDPEPFVGTNIMMSHIVLQYMSMGNGAALVAHPCVAVRGGNGGGYNLYKVFAYEWKRALFETGVKCGFKRESLTSVYDTTIKTFLRFWTIYMKINETNYDSSGVRLLFKTTWNYPSAWLYVYPFVLLPAGVLKALRSLYKRRRSFNQPK